MRADLQVASRRLGLLERAVLHEPLRRTGALLEDAETVQVLAPAWWRGRRALAVVTGTRLLLVRRELKCSTANQASFPLYGISHLAVHTSSPEGARFRLTSGLTVEEFSVTGGRAELEHALRAEIV